MSGLNNFVNQMMSLDAGDKVQLEYVWLGANHDMRGKSKTISVPSDKEVSLDMCPVWNYDGSSTEQALGKDSEVYVIPRKLYRDPFRPSGRNYLVLCDTWLPDLRTPHPTNERVKCAKVMKTASEHDAWFGFEMEFFMMRSDGRPIGFPNDGTVPEQGQFYCSVGTGNTYGRDIIECHYRACLHAGINVTGINAEVACGQWEYQVFGKGMDGPDDSWMTRYILGRVCEKFGVVASWEPKPIRGDCNGSGMHTNYSTKAMRVEGGSGLKAITAAIEKMSLKHKEHIKVYGEGNEHRLTGHHETASIDKFSWGFADRGASVRVGHETRQKGGGYMEDRRPASSCDMYKVASKIVDTTCL